MWANTDFQFTTPMIKMNDGLWRANTLEAWYGSLHPDYSALCGVCAMKTQTSARVFIPRAHALSHVEQLPSIIFLSQRVLTGIGIKTPKMPMWKRCVCALPWLRFGQNNPCVSLHCRPRWHIWTRTLKIRFKITLNIIIASIACYVLSLSVFKIDEY